MLKWQKKDFTIYFFQIPCNTGYAVYFRFRFLPIFTYGGKIERKNLKKKKLKKKI